MKIIIAGDLVVDCEYHDSKIDKDLVSLFNSADLRIVNLEAPVTTSRSKIVRTGPHLKANQESTKNVLNLLGIDIVTLANNHIKDFDSNGVLDTIAFLHKNNIKTVGAGKNLSEARKTLYVDTNEGRIAIVNFAENEWASATENTAASNPMDIIDNARQIQEARNLADYVFVIIHGGHEYYNLPSPRMQKQYRFYAEQGADIIIGHHTHCIGGHEIYNGVPIYYSLGNFLFTKNNKSQEWYTGLVLEVEISNGVINPKLHPVQQEKESFSLSLLQDIEKQKVLNRIEIYSRVIADRTKLSEAWEMYIDKQSKVYLDYWSQLTFINNRYFKGAIHKLGLNKIFYSRKATALYLNLMRCEVHRDLSMQVLNNKLAK